MRAFHGCQRFQTVL